MSAAKQPVPAAPVDSHLSQRSQSAASDWRRIGDGAKRMSPRPLSIVALGGGTGLSALLQGLKRHTAAWEGQPSTDPLVELAAVVTVSDDGGSSGKLRRAFDMLAPGDIRNCMVALAEDEALLSRLFRYRFANGKGLHGHSFGNLFLTALTEVTGDFHQAIRLSSEVSGHSRAHLSFDARERSPRG